jgi:hypothetical protein
MLYCNEINKLSIYKIRDNCICFIAKNHFAENFMYENSCYGVKCTDLAKNLIFALETSVE